MVKWYPLVGTALIQAANLGQITKMITEGSSTGQALLSYGLVVLALCLYDKWFRANKSGTIAVFANRMSIALTSLVALAVVFYR